MTEAEELAARLARYRAVKTAAAWLRERLEQRRPELYWPGAPGRPRPRQRRLF